MNAVSPRAEQGMFKAIRAFGDSNDKQPRCSSSFREPTVGHVGHLGGTVGGSLGRPSRGRGACTDALRAVRAACVGWDGRRTGANRSRWSSDTRWHCARRSTDCSPPSASTSSARPLMTLSQSIQQPSRSIGLSGAPTDLCCLTDGSGIPTHLTSLDVSQMAQLAGSNFASPQLLAALAELLQSRLVVRCLTFSCSLLKSEFFA